MVVGGGDHARWKDFTEAKQKEEVGDYNFQLGLALGMLMTRITMMEVMMMMDMVVLVIMMMPLTSHFLQDFLASILEDEQLHTLLNLYDQISTNSYRPFRFQTLQLQALMI